MTRQRRADAVQSTCNAAPSFVIRDGVLTIPSWEWDSTQHTLLGRRIKKARIVDGTVNMHRSVGLIFRIPPHIKGDIFWQHEASESDRATLYLDVDGCLSQWVDVTADEMLRYLGVALGAIDPCCPIHEQEG